MIYLNEEAINSMKTKWSEVINVIESATECIKNNDYAQPVKPYLRYREPQNRIIAMPAFVGGDINMAGIKWIASFPNNIKNDIPRAHSVIILNNSENGKPEAIINTALLSVIRTTAVTGAFIKAYSKTKELNNLKVGIIGFGPIGQNHLSMVTELLGEKISNIYLYDLSKIDKTEIQSEYIDKIHVTDNWEDAYKDSDIFITCTVSKAPYIDIAPKKGSLHLNISLRDYKTDIYSYVKDNIVVDDWEEICREKTDIEMMHLEKGLQEKDVKTIADVLCDNYLESCNPEDVIMFNPMGMAAYDIAVGSYFVNKSARGQVGQILK